MRIVNPTGELEVRATSAREGKNAGFVNAVVMANGWPAMQKIAGLMTERLEERGHTTAVFPYLTSNETPTEDIDRATHAADFVIAGAAT